MRVGNRPFDGPLLDLRGFPRRGPKERPIILTPQQIAQLARTVRRVPEVMVKVSGGASSVAGAVAHLRYVDRQGELAIETDEGQSVQGQGSERTLATDWDLEVSAAENAKPYRGKAGRKASKAGAQRRVLDAPGNAARQTTRGRPGVRARTVRASASLRLRPAHRSEASACAPDRQSAERTRAAPEHSKGNAARMAIALCRAVAGSGRGRQRDGAGGARSDARRVQGPDLPRNPARCVAAFTGAASADRRSAAARAHAAFRPGGARQNATGGGSGLAGCG